MGLATKRASGQVTPAEGVALMTLRLCVSISRSGPRWVLRALTALWSRQLGGGPRSR